MNRDKLIEKIQDIMGYPFYVYGAEVEVFPDKIEKICSDIIDEVQNVLCDDCEYSCNRSNCDRRDHG